MIQPKEKTATVPSLKEGAAIIRNFSKTLPTSPGVYRMIDHAGQILYIGKARNLPARVISYTRTDTLPNRLKRMVASTCSMEFVQTHTEIEALLLEANLIKKLKPRYNILFRDDKTFPHILITDDHDFPALVKHRGAQKRKGKYYGPFATAGAVNKTLTILQKAFLLRNCTDSVFKMRTRPCLQYQIKQCTAPCVNYGDRETYADQIKGAQDFLSGKSHQVQKNLSTLMTQASEQLDFESAARFRDRIRALTTLQATQDINTKGLHDADVIAIWSKDGISALQIFFFRGGRNYGNRPYFLSHEKEVTESEILENFIPQFYDDKTIPPLILTSIPTTALLPNALTTKAGHTVSMICPKRGTKKRLITHALMNAEEYYHRKMATRLSHKKFLQEIATMFSLPQPPNRIEIYDNSHIQGTNAIGAMVVFTEEGFQKNAYRKFNIKNTDAAGDDCAMMREVLGRRFTRLQKEGVRPDLILIDGGLGQLNSVLEVLADFEPLPVVAIAKGPDRHAGRERFFMPGKAPFQLDSKDPVLYFLQRLRDEAHRFAIGTHRAKRLKSTLKSPLDDIPGIGATRKKALLHHFGSATEVKQAGLPDLEATHGINKKVAQKIYDYFHTE